MLNLLMLVLRNGRGGARLAATPCSPKTGSNSYADDCLLIKLPAEIVAPAGISEEFSLVPVFWGLQVQCHYIDE